MLRDGADTAVKWKVESEKWKVKMLDVECKT